MRKIISASILALSLLSSVAIAAPTFGPDENQVSLPAARFSVKAAQLTDAWPVVEFCAMVAGQSFEMAEEAVGMDSENLYIENVEIHLPKIVKGTPVEKSRAILYFKHQLDSSAVQKLLKQAVACYNNLHKKPFTLELLSNNSFQVKESDVIIVEGTYTDSEIRAYSSRTSVYA